MSDHRTQPCGGTDNENDGCGIVFPRLSPAATLCGHCRKLLDARTPTDKESIIVSIAVSIPFIK